MSKLEHIPFECPLVRPTLRRRKRLKRPLLRRKCSLQSDQHSCTVLSRSRESRVPFESARPRNAAPRPILTTANVTFNPEPGRGSPTWNSCMHDANCAYRVAFWVRNRIAMLPLYLYRCQTSTQHS